MKYNICMDVAMPSTILSSIMEHLKSPIFEQSCSKQYWGLHAQLQELRSNLTLISDVLEDVELMGILFPDLCKKWVYQLLNVLNEADDLLDEARTRSRPTALPGKVDQKVRLNGSNLSFFHMTLPRKLKSRINKNLHEIVEEWRDYNLITEEPLQQPTTRTGSSTSTTSAAAAGTGGNKVGKRLVARKGIMRYDPENQSSRDIPKIKPSKDDHEAIKNKLLLAEHREKKIVWIVGGPGVGKTTLCRAVYDDKEVVRKFEIRLWVRLDGPDSYIPELKKIARQLELLEQGSEQLRNYKEEKHVVELDDDDDEEEEARQILYIRRLINGRRFLLVLDNYPPLPRFVPRKDDPGHWSFVPDTFLPKLRLLVDAETDTTEKSKIIITKLQGNMFGFGRTSYEIADFHEVKSLSPEVGKSLFDRTAFGSNKRQLQQAEWQRDLGEKIVSNCKGNPALIRCIGNFLHGRDDDRAAWDKFVLEYRYPTNGYHNRIAALYSTFRDSLHFIGYSSLLSTGFKYDALVSQLKASGLPNISMRMEKWFRDVLFLKLPSEDLWDDEPSHKLIPFLPSNLLEPPVQQGQATSRFEAIYEPPPSSSKHTDHKLENDRDPQYLRSFISLGNDSIICMPEPELDAFVSRLKCVRVLDLSSTGIKVLPHSIGLLFSLRYLDLSRNDFRKLPGSICKLKNLQTLKLVYCDKLFELPRGMGKLAPSLKIIRLDMSFHLIGMPRAISRLTGLETLDRFVVSERKGRLGYLEKLNNLGGRLVLDLPRWWNDATEDAGKADLESKTGITELQVKWPGVGQDGTGDASSAYGKKSSDDDHYDVLKRLKPNAALQKLVIVNFGGVQFPSWITEGQLSQINISQCKRCQALPPFHKMPHLKVLTLTSMNVEYVRHGRSNPTLFFPSLRKLSIGRMPKLKRWYADRGSDLGMPEFPKLDVVEIWNCGNLTALPRFSDVDDLTLEDVPETLIKSIEGKKCKNVTLKSIQKLTSLPSPFRSSVTESLIIEDCWNLTLEDVPETLIKSIDGNKFENVTLKSIKNLTSLPDRFIGLVKEKLIIEDCRNLEIPSNVTDLPKRLEFKGSNDVTVLPKGFQLLSSLTSLVELKIDGFNELEALPDGLQCLSSLEKLAIVNCGKMKGMSSTLKQLTNLNELQISKCSEEVDCFDDKKEEEMPWNDLHQLEKLIIQGFQKLTSLPKSLNGLDGLYELQIISCPALARVSDAFRGLGYLCQLKLSKCEKVDCLYDHEWEENKTLWKDFNISVLEIEGFQNLESLPESLKLNRWLYKIIVSDCKALKNVPEWKAKDVEELSVLMIKSCPEFSKEIKQLIKNHSFFKGGRQQSSDEADAPFYMKKDLNIYHLL